MKKKFVLSLSVVLLLAMVVLTCAACTPSVDGVKNKLEKGGYVISNEADDNGDYSDAGVTVTHVIGAYKENDVNEFVLVYWFASAEDADKVYENEKSMIDELKKEYEEDGMEFDRKIIKKGKMIAIGTSSAVVIVE